MPGARQLPAVRATAVPQHRERRPCAQARKPLRGDEECPISAPAFAPAAAVRQSDDQIADASRQRRMLRQGAAALRISADTVAPGAVKKETTKVGALRAPVMSECSACRAGGGPTGGHARSLRARSASLRATGDGGRETKDGRRETEDGRRRRVFPYIDTETKQKENERLK